MEYADNTLCMSRDEFVNNDMMYGMRESRNYNLLNLNWNVYIKLKGQIEMFNIFTEKMFMKKFQSLVKEDLTFTKFSIKLRALIHESFCNKKDYTVYVTAKDADIQDVEYSVYKQVMMNWESFIQYVWNNKKIIL